MPAPLAEPTVSQVLDRCGAYLGKRVSLAGYLGKCGGYDCMLFADKASAEAWDDYFSNLAAQRTAERPSRGYIGVGFKDEAWDQKAARFQRRYVVVVGRMDANSCDGVGGTDRSPGINPIDIHAWTRRNSAPAFEQSGE